MAETAPLHGVIMAGGGGTRFWPRSRKARPKQFLNLAGDRSLLQQAAERLAPLTDPSRTWIVTAAAQVDLVREQLPELLAARVVAEPQGRDTAAAVGLAAALIHRIEPSAVMVVTPADHLIEPAALCQRTLQAAATIAREYPAALVTLGIPPTYPATGYGYLQRGRALPSRNGIDVFHALGFREKPDLPTAERYLQAGDYLWNSGIFVWRVAAIRGELQRQQPILSAALDRIAAAWGTADQAAVFQAEYAALPRISIDYAVMEKAEEVLVLKAPFTWDDVGSWPALERHHPQDAAGNTVLGTSHLGLATKNCIVVGEPGQLIGTVGVENLLIIRSGDTVLVADRRDEAGLKKLVDQLAAAGFERFA